MGGSPTGGRDEHTGADKQMPDGGAKVVIVGAGSPARMKEGARQTLCERPRPAGFAQTTGRDLPPAPFFGMRGVLNDQDLTFLAVKMALNSRPPTAPHGQNSRE